MTMARINVVDGTIERTAAGGIHGCVFLEVGDQRFPDEHWRDFVVVLLGWWCRALSRCLEGDPGPIDIHFMEGPYLVELGHASSGTLRLALVERGRVRRTVVEAVVESRALIDSALVACTRVLALCRENGWWSDDTDELGGASADLKRSLLCSVN